MPDTRQSFYVSSGAFRSSSVHEIVQVALAAGIDRIELGSGLDWTSDILVPIRKTAGQRINYLVHNYFPPHEDSFVLNLAASDPATLERSLRHCRSAVDLTRDLGAPFFSVHAGFAFSARPNQLGKELLEAPRTSIENAHKIFVASLRSLCAYARSRHVRILVENNVVAPFNLFMGECTSSE